MINLENCVLNEHKITLGTLPKLFALFGFSVGRAVHSKDETQQSCNARRMGQINRYKANDLAMVHPFSVVIFSFCLLLNKYDKAIEALSLIHGHYYDDLESLTIYTEWQSSLKVIPN